MNIPKFECSRLWTAEEARVATNALGTAQYFYTQHHPNGVEIALRPIKEIDEKFYLSLMPHIDSMLKYAYENGHIISIYLTPP